jgi:maltokinase
VSGTASGAVDGGPADLVAAADPAALFPVRRAGEERRLVPPLSLVAPAVRLPGPRDGSTPPAAIWATAVTDAEGSLLGVPLLAVGGAVRRARPGDGAAAGLVRLLRDGTADAEVVRLAPPPAGTGVDDAAEMGITADQTHESVIVGEAVVVKWAVGVEAFPGVPPAVAALRHLGAAGFTETPQAYGFVVAQTPAGSVLLASANQFLPGASDGWDWYVDDVLEMAAGRLSMATAVAPAEVLGGLVARMHLAFATPQNGYRAPVARAGAADVEHWATRATAIADDALTLTGGDAGDRLRGQQPALRRALRVLSTPALRGTPTMRIHGDLHVGQILRWPGGYAISDFDGNPVLPAAERAAPQPAARDVAGMLRALDHVGRVVGRRLRGTSTDPSDQVDLVERWIRSSRVTFLAAYRAELAAAGGSALFDERLVRPFEVEQECREFIYAARHLPRWTYVPDDALPVLLDAVADSDPGGGA